MGKIIHMWNCLPNINQCDFDVDKVSAPIYYINRSIITRTEEVIKSPTNSLTNFQVVLYLYLDDILRTILTITSMPREGQQEREQ